jgi:hypothetical protein
MSVDAETLAIIVRQITTQVDGARADIRAVGLEGSERGKRIYERLEAIAQNAVQLETKLEAKLEKSLGGVIARLDKVEIKVDRHESAWARVAAWSIAASGVGGVLGWAIQSAFGNTIASAWKRWLAGG